VEVTDPSRVARQGDGDDHGAGVPADRVLGTGYGYGYVQIVADLFNAVTGLELGLGMGNRMVCSTQATRALERVGLIPGRSSAAVTPAELARYFGAAW